jgi:malic enzyme
VAVVSDGSAVLGLGDIGPLAALPVLEGKAALYKRFAGTAIVRLLQDVGVARIAVYDSHGVLHPGREDLGGEKKWLAEHTQPGSPGDSLSDALNGADVFIGVSAGGLPASMRPWSRPAAVTSRTRSTTCWRSPASSAACSTAVPGS